VQVTDLAAANLEGELTRDGRSHAL
jgi:hypothetical protein